MIVGSNIAIRASGAMPQTMDCPMNILSRDQQIAAISALTEGCSIRVTERLTGIHRDTIMRLGVRVGDGCAALHDEMMRFVQVNRLELDELWSYVGKKQRKVKQTDPADLGDQYVFTAPSATHKAIVSDRVGKRNWANTVAFAPDALRGLSWSSTPAPRHEGCPDQARAGRRGPGTMKAGRVDVVKGRPP